MAPAGVARRWRRGGPVEPPSFPRKQSEPAICAQYASIPQCEQATGGGGAETPAGGGGDAGSPGGIPGSAGSGADLAGGTSGALPFTGYPLTPLVLILLLLLIAALTVRAGLAIRDRIGANADGRPAG